MATPKTVQVSVYEQESKKEVPHKERMTLQEALVAAGCRPGRDITVTVNRHKKNMNYALRPGDHVVVVPNIHNGGA